MLQIDIKKMPLGKLSNRQMRSAYAVLTELQQEVAGAASPARILDASNRSLSPRLLSFPHSLPSAGFTPSFLTTLD